MPSKQEVLSFVRANPATTSLALAAHFKVDRRTAAASLKKLFDQGRLTRDIAGRTITNVKIYGYTFCKDDSEGKPGPSSKVTPEDNGRHRKTTGTFGDLIDQLAQALTSQIISRVSDHLQVEFSRLIPDAAPIALPSAADLLARISAPTDTPKAKKPKAVVVGLLPAQAGIISQEFHDAYDLEFWKDEGGKRLQTLAKHADVVFLHTGHMGHDSERLVRNVTNSFIRCSGGVASLKTEMTKWFALEWEAA